MLGHHRRGRRAAPVVALALAVALAVVLAACGDDDDSTATTAAPPAATTAPADEAAFPVTVTDDTGAVTLERRPERIVSLSASLTETLFAVGAGDQVIAVDDQSDYPPDAPVTDLSGFTPNLEAIAAEEPDLVVVSDDIDDVVEGLRGIDIPVLLFGAPSEIDGAYAQIDEIGAATGHPGAAADVVDGMQAEIEAIIEESDGKGDGLTYFHELDNTLFSVTSDTFVGAVYALLGLQNIADATPDAADSGGYPQLSAEFVVDADPDLIFLADASFGESADTVAARPGWRSMTAVTNDAIFALDEDVASRWGPRVVDFLDSVAVALDKVPTG